jgi:hypothetical protein
VLESAGPVLEELGAAMKGRRVVVLGGNHDHQLVAPWLERRRVERDGRLEVAETTDPQPFEPAGWLARRLGGAEVVLAYPGYWIAPGVYATHGHYLDCHITVPTLERLGVAACERLMGAPEPGPRSPEDYETTLAPLYALAYGLAQSRRPAVRAIGPGASLAAWRRMYPHGRSGGLVGAALRELVLPAGVAGLNLAGLGPFRADISGPELRRAGLLAIARVLELLGIEAEHVVCGHTHRAGPLDGDGSDFELASGARLVNPGSWIYVPDLIRGDGAASPYWPGRMALVEDGGPPRLVDVLGELGEETLTAARAA